MIVKTHETSEKVNWSPTLIALGLCFYFPWNYHRKNFQVVYILDTNKQTLGVSCASFKITANITARSKISCFILDHETKI